MKPCSVSHFKQLTRTKGKDICLWNQRMIVHSPSVPSTAELHSEWARSHVEALEVDVVEVLVLQHLVV